jgi:hypothetical protein
MREVLTDMLPGKPLKWSDVAWLPAILVGAMFRAALAGFLRDASSLSPRAIWWVGLVGGAAVGATVYATSLRAARLWREARYKPPVA